MTVPIPVSIRLRTTIRDVHITSEVDDLVFGSTSPGGFDTCTLTLSRPLTFQPAEVTLFGRLYIYDARNGSTVWEGRLQDPGRSAGPDGQTYAIAAVGGQAHLQDDTRQLVYIDTELNRWQRIENFTPGSTVEQIADLNDTGVPVMILRIPQGTTVDGAGAPSSSRCVSGYLHLIESGQKMARLSYNYDCGLTAATLTHSMYASTSGVGAADVPFQTTFSTVSSATSKVIGTDWTAGRNRPLIRFHFTGAGPTPVSADTWWLQVSGVNMLATRFDRNGNELLTGASYTSDFVTADLVVADLLGRVLGQTVDGPNATIAANSYLIEHLCYLDGVTPAKVLEDLIAFEQAYTYHLWDSNPANGKFRFEWVPWPTTVRYEADVIDGFSSPSSGNTVFNRFAARYNNRGRTHLRLTSQSVPALTAAGFDRTAYMDLGDEASTANNAAQISNQFMAEHRYPVNQGTLTVKTKILDTQTGRMVDPWEIRPGSLIRVRGVAAYPDALNPVGRDGNTIFKVAATSYSTADAAATLDLDSYSPSVARAIATMVRKPVVRRR